METSYSIQPQGHGASTIVPSTKGIVRQLLTLASDPENQVFIVQEEGCVAGLVGYLRNRDEHVVTMAAQALQFLTSNKANKEELLRFKDLIPNLSKLTTSKDGKIREFSSACLSNLNATAAGLTSPGSQQTCASECSPRNENVPVYNVQTSSSSTAPLPAQKKKAKMKTYCLEVEGIEDSFVRAAVERCLISQNGVISVTLDQRRGQAIVGTKPEKTVAMLIEELEKIGVNAFPYGASSKRAHSRSSYDEADAADGYLDEMDCFPHYTAGTGVMTTNGFGSMESRLSAKNDEADLATQAQKKVTSALSSAASWFW